MFAKSKLINVLLLILIATSGGILGSFFYDTSLAPEGRTILTKETDDGGRGFLRERLIGSGIYSPPDISRLNTYAARSVASIFRKKAQTNDALGNMYRTEERLGTGLVITVDGWIVVHRRTLSSTSNPKNFIINIGKDFYDLEKIVYDPLRKVTYAKISANNLRTITFSDSDEIKFGDPLFVVGGRNHIIASAAADLSWRDISVRTSVLRSEDFGRTIVLRGDFAEDFLGAPALDSDGDVAGLIEKIGTGYAIMAPINNVKRSLNELLAGKKFSQIYLGISYIDLNNEHVTNWSSNYGFLIYANAQLGFAGVVKSSPAEEAGIQESDIIIKINNEDVRGPMILSEIIDDFHGGETVNFSVLRDGKEILLKVVLEER